MGASRQGERCSDSTLEGIVERIRALSRQRADRLGLTPDASDEQLEAAAERVLTEVQRDRRLRRFFREAKARPIASVLVTWEVVVLAVGDEQAEARFAVLRRQPPPTPRSPSEPTVQDAGAGPSAAVVPDAAADSPRQVARRPRRLADTDLPDELSSLLGAVDAEATPAIDPRAALGYDHVVWLAKWVELAVGEAAFDACEAAVGAHPDVVAALHEDREELFVAAPRLHPHDVRTIVIDVLARSFDPGWEQRA